MAVLDELWKERHDFYLNVFFHKDKLPPYIKQHDRYSYDQLESIMDQSDVVITPSVWYETFGFTVLEALSYGVPVVVSDHVGAKDIIPRGCGLIFHSENELMKIISSLNIEQLSKMNQLITKNMKIVSEEELNQEIFNYGYQK